MKRQGVIIVALIVWLIWMMSQPVPQPTTKDWMNEELKWGIP